MLRSNWHPEINKEIPFWCVFTLGDKEYLIKKWSWFHFFRNISGEKNGIHQCTHQQTDVIVHLSYVFLILGSGDRASWKKTPPHIWLLLDGCFLQLAYSFSQLPGWFLYLKPYCMWISVTCHHGDSHCEKTSMSQTLLFALKPFLHLIPG